MSSSPSDNSGLDEGAAAASDPLRPSDHIDSAPVDDNEINQPKLGVVGWLRWGWRQLTSMRVALVLLLILAIAAIPGSVFPQRTADPNGVVQYKQNNPDIFPVLDAMRMFDVYSSPWFSAIYLLLFISLIGCIIPRIKHHAKALRALPPRTPARLGRLEHHRSVTRENGDPAAAIDVAEKQLKSLGYRVARYDRGRTWSVSAERGYWRETGNLLFHIALVGVLVTVGIGGGFAYTGQRVVIEGASYVNTLIDYNSINRGRFVADDSFQPYALTLDSFDVTYEDFGTPGAGQAGNFAANLSVRNVDGSTSKGTVRVNHPLHVGGDSIYLLGNGYAPTITVRNAEGEKVFSGPVEFLPQDSAMTSLGVVKITDGMPEQLGMIGFLYPTPLKMKSGAYTSVHGALNLPLLTLDVYQGDLGVDGGKPVSVFELDTDGLEKLNGRTTDTKSIELQPGETADLPDGLGTVTFENVSPEGANDTLQSVKRYVSLQIHHDASAPWVLAFALLALGGLGLALFVPRRRMWVKATAADDGIHLEYAALARGDDPTLAAAVDDLVRGHERLLEAAAPESSTPAKGA
ncbi:cytochrome c biogenesis protein ResB [Microbacterium sp. nov. GSS16]|uniref:cytochrome c biogenesis protein ResB n=1 Tax=Microbacterium sp. nov. GSS16 TaxID=3019890 RepID=UPI002305F778|nr:cytochrome c biogenesis protein ResB [Microbacterium sp. nov. GSS16]WCD92975.1 cytochrome c biogenesis protein ResB [Microbacterium sp. nov. GSS16]